MAQHTIGAYAGNVSGYVGNGPEVRGDAGSPRPASTALSGQFRQPFAPPAGPLGDGSPLQLERPELPETPDEESPARLIPGDTTRP